MLHVYARGNFKNVTIDLAIHSHSAPIFHLRCISIARKKILHLREEHKHLTIVQIFLFTIVLLRNVFHIDLVIGPWSAVIQQTEDL